MARIAYILLCHKDPDGVIAQVRALLAAGDRVAIHYDKGSGDSDYARLRAAFDGDGSVVFATRVKCGWGEWSLVQATLNGLRAAYDGFPDATHFYLISGDCAPIKPAAHCRAELDARDADIIESVDFFTSGWIRTGLVEERLIYRHIFNERSQRALYYASMDLQRMLGLRRRPPKDMQIRIGSQWWCLRRRTVDAVLALTRTRPDIVRFFKKTWIPDEIYFQSLVYHVVPRSEIASHTPTFLMFSDYGMPVNFYNDHYDFLLAQPEFFARKISGKGGDLRAALNDLYLLEDHPAAITGKGRDIFGFVTGKGRIGRRYGPRFWERDAELARDRRLMIVACKKWHVARRLIDAIGQASNMPTIDYLFDEADVSLPDLGGIESSLAKRRRNVRAVLSLLFDHFGTDRMVVCIDPSNIEIMHSLCADGADVRILSLECSFSDAYLEGHAERIGVIGQTAPEMVARKVFPALRNHIDGEVRALRDARFPHFHRASENADPSANLRAIAGFLDIPDDMAQQISRTPHLYAD